jgi:hypothetical protein
MLQAAQHYFKCAFPSAYSAHLGFMDIYENDASESEYISVAETILLETRKLHAAGERCIDFRITRFSFACSVTFTIALSYNSSRIMPIGLFEPFTSHFFRRASKCALIDCQ